MIISLYRNKPVFRATAGDSEALLKAVGCFPYNRPDQFYITDMVRAATKAKSGTPRYKEVYNQVAAKLQYMKRKGKVVNVRYGLWAWVKLYPKVFYLNLLICLVCLLQF